MNLEELVKFAAKAKVNAYASDTDPIFKEDKKLFFYNSGDWEYIDAYHDSEFAFHGTEVIKYKGKVVWKMSYHGEVLVKDRHVMLETYKVVRNALKQPNPKLPLRGPRRFSEHGLEYFFETAGDMTNFTGREEVHKDEQFLYKLNCIGGIL